VTPLGVTVILKAIRAMLFLYVLSPMEHHQIQTRACVAPALARRPPDYIVMFQRVGAYPTHCVTILMEVLKIPIPVNVVSASAPSPLVYFAMHPVTYVSQDLHAAAPMALLKTETTVSVETVDVQQVLDDFVLHQGTFAIRLQLQSVFPQMVHLLMGKAVFVAPISALRLRDFFVQIATAVQNQHVLIRKERRETQAIVLVVQQYALVQLGDFAVPR